MSALSSVATCRRHAAVVEAMWACITWHHHHTTDTTNALSSVATCRRHAVVAVPRSASCVTRGGGTASASCAVTRRYRVGVCHVTSHAIILTQNRPRSARWRSVDVTRRSLRPCARASHGITTTTTPHDRRRTNDRAQLGRGGGGDLPPTKPTAAARGCGGTPHPRTKTVSASPSPQRAGASSRGRQKKNRSPRHNDESLSKRTASARPPPSSTRRAASRRLLHVAHYRPPPTHTHTHPRTHDADANGAARARTDDGPPERTTRGG